MMLQRPTSTPRNRCDRLSRFYRIILMVAALFCPSSSVAVAGELELAQPVNKKKSVEEPKPDSALRVAQRKTDLFSDASPVDVDFDVADLPEKKQNREVLLSGVQEQQGVFPTVDVNRDAFSAAFSSAIQNIQKRDAKLRPTPARPRSPLGLLMGAVEEDVVKTTKQKLDLATEVRKSTAKRQATSRLKTNKLQVPMRSFPQPEAVAPSVAGPVGVAPRKETPKPLAVELDSYFDNLDARPTPTAERAAKTLTTAPTVVKTVPPSTKSVRPGAIVDPIPAAPRPTDTPQTAPVIKQPPVAATPAPRHYPPREPNVRITQRMAQLQPRIAKALRFYFDHPLNTHDDSAWSVMHSMLGYGPNGLVAINGERGRRTNAVHWLCQNGLCANRRLLYIEDGYIKGLEGPGYQGHPGQFLAMLAQIGTEREFPMNIQGQRLNVDALINSEMYTCSSQKELTFKLISMSYYLDSEATWKSENGETWSMPKMLSLEMSQPVNGAACGGTHRIMAISCAVRNRWLRGEPIDGVYAQAQQYVRQYQQYAMSLQNRDGSYSTDWFKRPASSKDKDRQLQTTGHILEWMVYTLPRNELSDPRIVKAVEFLTNLMARGRFRDWEVGPRGHAIRALSLYHQRVFERQPATPKMANAALWSSVLR